jgi:guanylate cyclase
MISFFPHETIPLRPLIFRHHLSALHSISNRSVIYQIHRVHLFRQSATSRAVASDFARVERFSQAAIGLYCDFWADLAIPVSSDNNKRMSPAQAFARLTAARLHSETAWADLLDRHPNNPRLFDDYALFLLEVKSDFETAVRWHQKARNSEGRRVHDRLFRAFIAAFPFYIRRGIVDSHGKLCPAPQRLSSEPESAQDHVGSAGSGDLNTARLDLRAADDILDCPQLRLAMRQCVSTLQSPVRLRVQVASIVRFLLSIAFAIVIAVFLDSVWASNSALFRHLQRAVAMHESAAMAMALLPLGWMRQAFGRAPGNWSTVPGFLDATANSRLLVLNLSIEGLAIGDSLSRGLYLTAHADGAHAVALAHMLVRDEQTSLVCNASDFSAIPDSTVAGLDYIFREFFLSSAQVAMRGYDRNFAMCSLVLRALSLADAARSLTACVAPPYAEYTGREDACLNIDQAEMSFLIALTPALVLFLALPGLAFAVVGWPDEHEQHAAVMRSVDPEEMARAGTRMSPGPAPTVAVLPEIAWRAPIWLASAIGGIALCIALLVPLIATSAQTPRVKGALQQHALFNGFRGRLAEVVEHGQLFLLLNSEDAKPYWSIDRSSARMREALEELVYLDTILHHEDTLSFSKEIGRIRFVEHCVAEDSEGFSYGYIACLSLHRVVGLILDMSRQILAAPDLQLPSDQAEAPALTFVTRAAEGFRELSDEYERAFNVLVSETRVLVWLMFGVAVVITGVTLVADAAIAGAIAEQLETVKALLLRLPPLAFVSNEEVKRLVFKRGGRDQLLLTGAQAVFNSAKDAMLALTRDAIIEAVNRETTALFGFTPDQLLGQTIGVLISPDTTVNTELHYTMKLMKNGQTPLLFEADVTGVRDDESAVKLHAVLVGLPASPGSAQADSFALICRDRSTEERDNEAVDGARREAGRLRDALIPAAMQVRIARHENSFTAKVATVMMINIHQFALVMAIIPPTELFATLSSMFSTFDGILSEFPSLVRVAILGDVYVAVGGLFSNEGEVQSFTADLVFCAGRCLEKMDDSTDITKISANIQLRIGIHTGGPLHAGIIEGSFVLGVVGDIMQCAQELEHRAHPGSANVSAATYEHISSAGIFSIEPHEEIDLPPCGRQMTYTVTPRKEVAGQSSKYKSRYGSVERQGFTMPSLDALINVGPVGFAMGDHALLDPNDAYDPTPMDLPGAALPFAPPTGMSLT